MTDVIEAYMAAWSEADDGKRRALLEQAWADDGIYSDPTAEVRGRDALVAHIGGFLASAPGTTFAAASGVDRHHDAVRFAWSMRDASGNTLLDGIDFGLLDGDGRLTRITGFFGPLQ